MHFFIILLVVAAAFAFAHRHYRSHRARAYDTALDKLEAQSKASLGADNLHSLRVFLARDANWRTLVFGGRPALAAVQGKTLRVAWQGAGNRVETRDVALADCEMVVERPGELSYGVPIVVRLTTTQGPLVVHCADEDGDADNPASNALFEQLTPLVKHAKRSAAGPLSNALKLAFLAPLILATYALVKVSSDRPLAGPMTVAVSKNGQVAAAGERMLYVFDGPDREVREIDLNELGLVGLVTHLAYSPEGELHMADSAAGSIFACDEYINECGFLAEMPDFNGPFGESFKFAFSPDGTRILVTDTYRNRLVELARDGDLRANYPANVVGLCLPNGIAFGRDGNLYVADSNHLRIAEFSFVDGKLRNERSYPTYSAAGGYEPPPCITATNKLSDLLKSSPALPGMREDRARPVAIAQLDDGSWWATLSNDRIDSADVAIFDAEWTNPRRVALDEDSDSFALAALGSSMLIADTEAPGLHRGDAATATAVALAQPKFAAVMDKVAGKRLLWNLMRIGAILLMVLATLGALAYGMRRGQLALQRLTA